MEATLRHRPGWTLRLELGHLSLTILTSGFRWISVVIREWLVWRHKEAIPTTSRWPYTSCSIVMTEWPSSFTRTMETVQQRYWHVVNDIYIYSLNHVLARIIKRACDAPGESTKKAKEREGGRETESKFGFLSAFQTSQRNHFFLHLLSSDQGWFAAVLGCFKESTKPSVSNETVV